MPRDNLFTVNRQQGQTFDTDNEAWRHKTFILAFFMIHIHETISISASLRRESEGSRHKGWML